MKEFVLVLAGRHIGFEWLSAVLMFPPKVIPPPHAPTYTPTDHTARPSIHPIINLTASCLSNINLLHLICTASIASILFFIPRDASKREQLCQRPNAAATIPPPAATQGAPLRHPIHSHHATIPLHRPNHHLLLQQHLHRQHRPI